MALNMQPSIQDQVAAERLLLAQPQPQKTLKRKVTLRVVLDGDVATLYTEDRKVHEQTLAAHVRKRLPPGVTVAFFSALASAHAVELVERIPDEDWI